MSDLSRQQWGSKFGFLISAIGSAVGLGNIWRFPHVLYSNGGGAFLIPYFIAMFTTAIPLLILEYTIGSKFRGTSPLSWARIRKKYEWLGWLPAFLAGFIVFYYSVILAWALNYTWFSFTMAWGYDPNTFFFVNFLNISDGPLRLGSINVPILIGLVMLWGSAYLFCSKRVDKGIETCNKILMPLMFVILIFIIIRSLMLPGAAAGLNTLFTPDFSAMANPRIWLAAYGHVFFSCSLAMGIMITYSSYLPKDAELVNSAMTTGFANSWLEILCAIGVFAILGFMAQASGVGVTEVVSSGVGLAFIAFPSVFNTMDGGLGHIMGIMFFACLIVTGYTSYISLLEAFIAPMSEKFKMSRKKAYAVFTLAGFSLSAIFATGAGLYILDIADYFINNFGLVFVGLCQALIIGWIVKVSYFRNLANENTFIKIGKWWDICIKYVIPVTMTASLFLALINILRDGYGDYPAAALAIYGYSVIAAAIVFSFVFQKIKWATQLEMPGVTEPPPSRSGGLI